MLGKLSNRGSLSSEKMGPPSSYRFAMIGYQIYVSGVVNWVMFSLLVTNMGYKYKRKEY